MLVLLGLANLRLNAVHRAGNRYHMDIARCAWEELERLARIAGSPGAPMELRVAVRKRHGFEPTGRGVGHAAYRAIQWIPIAVVVIGVGLIVCNPFATAGKP